MSPANRRVGRRLAPALALLSHLWIQPAAAQPSGPGPVALAHATAMRADVDASIRVGLTFERARQTERAIQVMRAAVQRTSFRDAKARYFLARFYMHRHVELVRARDLAGARDREGMALLHLRAARDLGRQNAPLAQPWANHAQDRLHDRARRTPLLNQHTEGGQYPWGYCGPTAVRMVLRLERLSDPGADATALRGARPYQPGTGSWLFRLSARGAELGLRGAEDSMTGSIAQIVRHIDEGRPVILSGEGPFRAMFADDGAVRARSYQDGHYLVAVGYERDANRRISALILNDSDTGRRLRMAAADARRFFRGDGSMRMVTYTR